MTLAANGPDSWILWDWVARHDDEILFRLRQHVTLTGPIAAPDADPIEILALDTAMERLQVFDARQARIVELCYFGGLTCLEAGQALGISEATVHRDLRHARAWLRRELSAT